MLASIRSADRGVAKAPLYALKCHIPHFAELHPDDYPGNTLAEKYLRNEDLRRQMLVPNIIRDWLCYCAADLRRDNRRNMHLIGITEKEVMDFTNHLGKGEAFEEEELDQYDFDRPRLNQDSLAVHLSFAREIDSLLRVKKGARK